MPSDAIGRQKPAIIGLQNDLTPGKRQAISETNDDASLHLLDSIRKQGTNLTHFIVNLTIFFKKTKIKVLPKNNRYLLANKYRHFITNIIRLEPEQVFRSFRMTEPHLSTQ